MAGNEFSPEEVKILNKNPYTLKATSKRIMFTLEGKKKILALYEEGKAITQILREMGYAGVIVYRTDIQGTIECISDGETISFLQ